MTDEASRPLASGSEPVSDLESQSEPMSGQRGASLAISELVSSFPLDRGRGLGTDVVGDPVDIGDFVDHS
jgi:hypothetical protein